MQGIKQQLVRPEMKRIVKKMFDNFKDGEWDKLMESMPARMAVVIAAKRGSTKY